MPRDIPVGNGQMLVAFDQYYQIRDLYFPHVGQENHAQGGPCRFGVWSPLPPTQANLQDRRRRRLFWSPQGWQIRLGYLSDTLATDVTMRHPNLLLELRCTDVVDFHRPILVRRIEVRNLLDQPRHIHIYHHNNFAMYGTRVGDTVYFDPMLRCLIHYQANRYLTMGWFVDGELRMDEFATGFAGFLNAEGTWRDAEDGRLGGNTIAQGAVDSTMGVHLDLAPAGSPGGSRLLYMIIGAGQNYKDIEALHRFLHREGPQQIIDRTVAYWRLWLKAMRVEFPDKEQEPLAPSPAVAELFKRSLLIVRSQIDNSGAIIAANDTDIMQFQRDTYSYLWPRDGALVAAALDDAGFPDVARSFYSLCTRLISEQGYFFHKYNPDGSPASSWHPWVSLGRPQLPIQEDETALVVWALWRHYQLYRDIEFVRPLWLHLIAPAADFLVRFRDPDTHLPLPSYNLWEDSWGIHAFTVASVFGGLHAGERFATCFGDQHRAEIYRQACQEIRQAFCHYFWSETHQRFLRRIVPLDHARTARLMAEVMAGRTPRSDHDQPYRQLLGPEGNGRSSSSNRSPSHRSRRQKPSAASHHPALVFEYDNVVDSSLFGIFAFGLLEPDDPRVEKTMQAVEEKLTVRTPVGGLARYEGDAYHRAADPSDSAVPGNPWFICTLWLAQWYIARARQASDLARALPIFEWVATHALPSGVLAEQVHPYTNQPLSVSPLTWSHATVISTVCAYLQKLQQMSLCPTCGQVRPAVAVRTAFPPTGP